MMRPRLGAGEDLLRPPAGAVMEPDAGFWIPSALLLPPSPARSNDATPAAAPPRIDPDRCLGAPAVEAQNEEFEVIPPCV
jgi:hypothetical protein